MFLGWTRLYWELPPGLWSRNACRFRLHKLTLWHQRAGHDNKPGTGFSSGHCPASDPSVSSVLWWNVSAITREPHESTGWSISLLVQVPWHPSAISVGRQLSLRFPRCTWISEVNFAFKVNFHTFMGLHLTQGHDLQGFLAHRAKSHELFPCFSWIVRPRLC